MRNARFWEYVNGDYVKLTLAPGQELVHSQGHRTEEGWQRESKWWAYDAEQGVVLCDLETAARDCDGRFDHSWEGSCAVDRLRVQVPYRDEHYTDPEEIRCPDWETIDRRQRDYAAEAMGY